MKNPSARILAFIVASCVALNIFTTSLLIHTSEAAFVSGNRKIGRTRKHKQKMRGKESNTGFVNYNFQQERSTRHGWRYPFQLSAAKISSEEVRTRNIQQLEKLRMRDRQSRKLTPSELKIVFEDDYIVCVDKPPGVLCVPSEEGIPTLAQAVFEMVPNKQSSLDKMVVHRLGMDTSGLVLFAKTMESLRGMNTLFRTRKITRKYEALVCGHVANDEGAIDLPLMRDYMRPPYMRISTEEHQRVLVDLDDTIVGKKLLEAPKASKTTYKVMSRETFLDTDLPVTRLLLTSVTGRTHQLNVHMAAIGHPIVGDRVYGLDGEAIPNGGLDLSQFPNDNNSVSPASIELQRSIGAVATNMCVHAKCLSFRHPMLSPDEDPLYFECEAPF